MNARSPFAAHGSQQGFGPSPLKGLPSSTNRKWQGLLIGFLLLLLTAPACPDPRGQLSLGGSFDGWSSNTTLPFKGSEILAPFYLTYGMDPGFWLSFSTAFASGSYTDSIAGTQTLNLSALTSTSVTSDFYFKGFGANHMAEFSLILPTGDSSWETKQVASNIPALFINSRYQSEGWGFSALYGLSFSAAASVEYGVSAGYSFAGPYDPYYGGQPGVALKMGDSIFLAFNRVESFTGNQSSIFRLCVMTFLPTQTNGFTNFQLGPNGSASYSFNNPTGFSWSVGAQIYTLSNRYYLNSGGEAVYGQEPYGSSGQRFNFSPSLALGNLTLNGLIQYVEANGYPLTDYSGLYNGGGFVFGFTPTYAWNLDDVSSLSFNAGYNFITAHNASTSFTVDVDYQYWSVGANYAIKLY